MSAKAGQLQRLIDGALRRLAVRPHELDQAVRLQNGDAVSEIQDGRLEPGGQLVLTLKDDEQSATKGDIAALTSRLATIQDTLAGLVGANQVHDRDCSLRPVSAKTQAGGRHLPTLAPRRRDRWGVSPINTAKGESATPAVKRRRPARHRQPTTATPPRAQCDPQVCVERNLH